MMVAMAIVCGIAPASAATWIVTPSVALEETATDNVDLQPAEFAKADLVTQLTPSLVFSGQGPHAKLTGSVSAAVLLYARTGAENNYVYPFANVAGNVEAIDKFFYVDASAFVSQQFLNPFGAQPVSLATATENRYTSSVYRVSPYIQGVTTGNVQYELRNDSYWTLLNGAPTQTSDSYTSQWTGKLDSPVTPLGWSAISTDRRQVQQPGGADDEPGGWAALRPQGYGSARMSGTGITIIHASYRGYIYGVGLEWRPTRQRKSSPTGSTGPLPTCSASITARRSRSGASAHRETSRIIRSSWRRCRPAMFRES
jgi:uncharacterized protein (PEP-CTERM system associated)